MKTITKYEAVDGTEFADILKCEEYERLIDRINIVFGLLADRPTGTSYANGNGYVQQQVESVRSVEEKMRVICDEYLGLNGRYNNSHISVFGRIACDSNVRALNNAFYRLQCIDAQGREWGQPYYANNPNPSAKQLN